jgi:hypothetical protein
MIPASFWWVWLSGRNAAGRDIKDADLENMTPMQALDFLRRLKGEL